MAKKQNNGEKLFVTTCYRRMKQVCLVTVKAKDVEEAEKRAIQLLSTISDRNSKKVKVIAEEVFLDDSQSVDSIHEVEVG